MLAFRRGLWRAGRQLYWQCTGSVQWRLGGCRCRHVDPSPPPPPPPPPSPSLLQERMETIRRDQDAAEVAECSFRPRINPKSARLVEQRQTILRVCAGWAARRGLSRGCHVKCAQALPPCLLHIPFVTRAPPR